MLTDKKYVTSFSGATGDDILSERIVIASNLYEDDFWEPSAPLNAYYKVSIREDPTSSDWTRIIDLNWYDSDIVSVSGGVGWRTCNYNPVGGWKQEIWISPIEIQIIGSHVGALKVEAIYEFTSGIPFTPHWNKLMSRDYAYLISGEGNVNIQGYQPWQTPMFEIGETVPIQVSADYSGPTIGETGRWQLWAFPLRGGSGRLLKEWNYDYFRETYDWELPTDAWVRGASDSKWRIELRNTLFSTDAIMVNTIDIRANAPPTPTISITPDDPQVEDTLTISISADTNSFTHEKITKFWVRAVETDTSNQFVYKSVYPDSGSADPYTATTTIDPRKAGDIFIQVWAHDEAGRESVIPGVATITIHEGKYSLSLTVLDEYNSIAIESVKVSQIGGSTKYTDSQGKCWFDLDKGQYSFQFIKAGYRAKTGSWSIVGDRDETVYLTRTTNTWDLTVTVQNKDGSTVWGSRVTVGTLHKNTDSSGECVFRDVPEGEYVVIAEADELSGTKTINLDRTQSIIVVLGEDDVDGAGLDPIVILGIISAIIIVLVGVYVYYRERRIR
jgi:hypothetical protein